MSDELSTTSDNAPNYNCRTKTEGWQFLQLTGHYRRHLANATAYPLFASRVEDILQQDVDAYVTTVAAEPVDKPPNKPDRPAPTRPAVANSSQLAPNRLRTAAVALLWDWLSSRWARWSATGRSSAPWWAATVAGSLK